MFQITHVPTPWLDGKHAVFGEVTEGKDVVDSIAQGDKITAIEILDSTDELFAAVTQEASAVFNAGGALIVRHHHSQRHPTSSSRSFRVSGTGVCAPSHWA